MLSVLFSTFNGESRLSRTLDSLSMQDYKEDWQLIVVDNNSSDGTSDLLTSYLGRLPLTIIKEHKNGKNIALNKAVPLAQGDYIVFTDDDIRADVDWLSNIATVINKHPDYAIFGGEIVPEWEVSPPEWVLKWAPLGVLYAVKENTEDGECDPGKVWGPNMVVKRSLFTQHQMVFNESIGPDGTDCYPMGSETEFTKRAYSLGFKCYSSNKFKVHHWVPQSSVTREWIFGRAVRLGSGVTLTGRKEFDYSYLLSISLGHNLYRLLCLFFGGFISKRTFWWQYKANYYLGCIKAMKKLQSQGEGV